jgi:hypothetical protein
VRRLRPYARSWQEAMEERGARAMKPPERGAE